MNYKVLKAITFFIIYILIGFFIYKIASKLIKSSQSKSCLESQKWDDKTNSCIDICPQDFLFSEGSCVKKCEHTCKDGTCYNPNT
jgi:hypothetical protein